MSNDTLKINKYNESTEFKEKFNGKLFFNVNDKELDVSDIQFIELMKNI